ncbi:YceI family protein [Mycobacterium paraterrae]|uniref:YceI family protein n=1 Tax=Mycobacterium paraterrae TaxID=577492 RepID=UPI003313DA9F
MRIGLIGSGTLARAIALRVVEAGHDVVFSNSRGPETLADIVADIGHRATAGTVADAGASDIVVLAVNWKQVCEALAALPARTGRILVDATNQWADPPPHAVVEQIPIGGSEFIAALMPDAHVIKAFDNMYGPVIAADPLTDRGRRILFYAGDHSAAKDQFHSLAVSLGYAPVDLGPLSMGRLMQVDGPLTGLHALREPVGHPVNSSGSDVWAPNELPAGEWQVDVAHSSITFAVSHFSVGKVRGRFGDFNATIEVAGGAAPSVNANINVASVDTGNGARDEHLRGADFFDVANHPTARFTSTSVHRLNSDYRVAGDFQLAGITKPVELFLTFNGLSAGMNRGPVAGFQASASLDRRDFGITINTPLDSGGLAIGHTVALSLDMQAVRAG